MERAERMILLGIGFLSPAFLVPVLWVMLALTTATALGRFVKVWRPGRGSGSGGHRPTPPSVPQRRPQRSPGRRSEGVDLPVPLAGTAPG